MYVPSCVLSLFSSVCLSLFLFVCLSDHVSFCVPSFCVRVQVVEELIRVKMHYAENALGPSKGPSLSAFSGVWSPLLSRFQPFRALMQASIGQN